MHENINTHQSVCSQMTSSYIKKKKKNVCMNTIEMKQKKKNDHNSTTWIELIKLLNKTIWLANLWIFSVFRYKINIETETLF